MSPRHFSKIYKSICEKAGIKHTGIHTLRHTHATELLEAGVDIKVMSERIGHADIRTTFNIYVHPSEDFHKHELEKLIAKRQKAIFLINGFLFIYLRLKLCLKKTKRVCK